MLTDLLTIDEAAVLLKCKRASLYEQTRERARVRHEFPIPFVRLPFGLRFSKTALESWLEQIAGAQAGDQ